MSIQLPIQIVDIKLDSSDSEKYEFHGYGSAVVEYEDIFEGNGRWLLGKSIISDVVNFVNGKSLVAAIDREYPSRIIVEIPLPMVRDEISNKFFSIAYMVPSELQCIFMGRLTETINAYLGEKGVRSLDQFYGAPATGRVVSDVQAHLSAIERSREASGDGQLWKFVAHYLGMPTSPTHIDLAFSYVSNKS